MSILRNPDPDQRKALKMFVEYGLNLSLWAVAGAGKTTMCLEASRLLHKRYPGSSSLVLSFNNIVTVSTRKKIKKYFLQSSILIITKPEDLFVAAFTFHSLAIQIIERNYPHAECALNLQDTGGERDREVKLTGKDVDNSVLLRLSELLDKGVIDVQRFDFLFLDESQDLPTELLKFIKAVIRARQRKYTDGAKLQICVLGDPLQMLYKNVIIDVLVNPANHLGEFVGEFHRVRLATSWRLSDEMIDFMNTHMNPTNKTFLARWGPRYPECCAKLVEYWGDGFAKPDRKVAGETDDDENEDEDNSDEDSEEEEPGIKKKKVCMKPTLLLDTSSIFADKGRVINKVLNAYMTLENKYGKRNTIMLATDTTPKSLAAYIYNEAKMQGKQATIWNRNTAADFKANPANENFKGNPLMKLSRTFTVISTINQVKGDQRRAGLLCNFDDDGLRYKSLLEHYCPIYVGATRFEMEMTVAACLDGGRLGLFPTFDVEAACKGIGVQTIGMSTNYLQCFKSLSFRLPSSAQFMDAKSTAMQTITLAKLMDFVPLSTVALDSNGTQACIEVKPIVHTHMVTGAAGAPSPPNPGASGAPLAPPAPSSPSLEEKEDCKESEEKEESDEEEEEDDTNNCSDDWSGTTWKLARYHMRMITYFLMYSVSMDAFERFMRTVFHRLEEASSEDKSKSRSLGLKPFAETFRQMNRWFGNPFVEGYKGRCRADGDKKMMWEHAKHEQWGKLFRVCAIEDFIAGEDSSGWELVPLTESDIAQEEAIHLSAVAQRVTCMIYTNIIPGVQTSATVAPLLKCIPHVARTFKAGVITETRAINLIASNTTVCHETGTQVELCTGNAKALSKEQLFLFATRLAMHACDPTRASLNLEARSKAYLLFPETCEILCVQLSASWVDGLLRQWDGVLPSFQDSPKADSIRCQVAHQLFIILMCARKLDVDADSPALHARAHRYIQETVSLFGRAATSKRTRPED